MKKKGLTATIICAALLGIGIAAVKYTKFGFDTTDVKIKETSEKISFNSFHSEILRLIVSCDDKISSISSKKAQEVLESRIGKEVEVDKQTPNLRELPFEVVRLIAKSPASIAGVSPKKAWNEAIRRYLVIDTSDDNIDPAALLNMSLEQTKESLEKWAENEDAEAIEAFMKEEADRDPSAFANFAYGLKHVKDKRSEAVSYMERFANHAHSDSFDTKNEEESYKTLIEAIKNIK